MINFLHFTDIAQDTVFVDFVNFVTLLSNENLLAFVILFWCYLLMFFQFPQCLLGKLRKVRKDGLLLHKLPRLFRISPMFVREIEQSPKSRAMALQIS